MPNATLKDLFVHTLKDMYFAENAIYKALPKMIDAAHTEELKEGLSEHRDETKEQISRLEEIFKMLDMKPSSVTCKGISGILEEGEEVVKEFGAGDAGDAGVIAACQAVEHYEITRYGTMHAWAMELGMDDAVELIEETLAEEHAADEKLTAIAEGGVNEEADSGEEEEEEGSVDRGRTPQRAAAKSAGGGAARKSSPQKKSGAGGRKH